MTGRGGWFRRASSLESRSRSIDVLAAHFASLYSIYNYYKVIAMETLVLSSDFFKAGTIISTDVSAPLMRQQKCCWISFCFNPPPAPPPPLAPPVLHHTAAKHKRTDPVRHTRLLNNWGRHPWRVAALPWFFRTPSCARGWPCPACREVWQRDLTVLLPWPWTRRTTRKEWAVGGHRQLGGPPPDEEKAIRQRGGQQKRHVKLGI